MILPEIVESEQPISAEWYSYRAKVLKLEGDLVSPAAGALRELKRAFFAGAMSMSAIIYDLDELDRVKAEALSERIQKDLYEFGRLVKIGRD